MTTKPGIETRPEAGTGTRPDTGSDRGTEPRSEPLRALIVEDDPYDAELMVATLQRAGYDLEWRVVDREAEFLDALEEDWDVILSDYDLLDFDGPTALLHCQERQVQAPLLIVSGTVGEERAVAIMRSGAADYLLKDRLTRLGMAVRRAQEAQRLAVRSSRLRTAMEQTGVGVMITSDSGQILYVNSAFEDIIGHPEEAALGRGPEIFCCDDGEDAQVVEMGRAIDRGDAWRGRLRHCRPDGTQVELDLTLSPICDPDGEVNEFVGVARDVSEQLALERAFRQAQKMEAVGRLAGGVAHDFNNLLTAIIGYNELLLAEAPGGRAEYYLKEIRRAAQRGATLTSQLLTFSRQERAWPERLELPEVVEGCRGMLERIIGEDVDLRVESHGWSPPVEADRSQLEQVIVNLVVNARDALPTGGSITLSTGELVVREAASAADQKPGDLEPGVYSTLTVADTGVGIDPEVRERIFEPFFTTKEPGKGTGLGLSTVFGIVSEADGSIEVTSEPGRGTSFTVLLPAHNGDASLAPAADAQSDSDLSDCTVLVVEDEEATGRLIHRLLSEDGHRVLLAHDAEEALDTWHRRSGGVDVLLTDVVLPGRSGPELAEEVRRLSPGTPVLFMSGYPGRALEQASLGDYGYLPKPFTPDDLRQALARMLEN